MTTCFSSWMLEFSAGSIYISLAECVSNQIATELNLKMATKCFGRILLLVSVFFNETIYSRFINSYSKKKVRMYLLLKLLSTFSGKFANLTAWSDHSYLHRFNNITLIFGFNIEQRIIWNPHLNEFMQSCDTIQYENVRFPFCNSSIQQGYA